MCSSHCIATLFCLIDISSQASGNTFLWEPVTERGTLRVHWVFTAIEEVQAVPAETVRLMHND